MCISLERNMKNIWYMHFRMGNIVENTFVTQLSDSGKAKGEVMVWSMSSCGCPQIFNAGKHNLIHSYMYTHTHTGTSSYIWGNAVL